ncbi:Na(+)/H(+) antiporter subunit F1 [Aliibacillus thermotolerans]|uniref:Na(+)/H(+) antiporter subunit F1 n=1 Tax=Aliibacillus thermotolerans TaxID=1834418 RepID=A0ABW0U8U0_9BACI|nr:Na(+)/H(+) antiporter subunit F1 [Aliibacillus thermotolerans]MDA3131084.1 Na(+)/H(+) antiporter subunit F1 [Aliibacillus thermotolerans]
MFHTILFIALFLLSISIFICLYRLVKGPTRPDRVLALDAIGFNIIGVVTVLSILLHTLAFLEVILLIGILAFLGTIALSKFIEKGTVIDYERSD